MKNIITLLSFLAITSTSSHYAMEHENLKTKDTVIPLYSTIGQEKNTLDAGTCPSATRVYKHLEHFLYPHKENLKIIAQGIGAGALTFGGLEALTALIGDKAMAGNPTVLILFGCVSFAFCCIYIGAMMERCCCNG